MPRALISAPSICPLSLCGRTHRPRRRQPVDLKRNAVQTPQQNKHGPAQWQAPDFQNQPKINALSRPDISRKRQTEFLLHRHGGEFASVVRSRRHARMRLRRRSALKKPPRSDALRPIDGPRFRFVPALIGPPIGCKLALEGLTHMRKNSMQYMRGDRTSVARRQVGQCGHGRGGQLAFDHGVGEQVPVEALRCDRRQCIGDPLMRLRIGIEEAVANDDGELVGRDAGGSQGLLLTCRAWRASRSSHRRHAGD